MRNSLKITKWEVMRNLTNKQFLIGLLVTPLIMAFFIGLPRLLERWDRPSLVTVYLLGNPELAETLSQAITDPNIKLIPYEDTDEIDDVIYREKAGGYLVLSDTFWQDGKLSYHYNKRNPEQFAIIHATLSQLLQYQRMQELQISPEQVGYITVQAEIESIAMEKAAAPKRNAAIISIAFMVLIYFLIFSSGSMLMQSALQERRDRMAEIVLSSITASQLMHGKIMGHFILGMIQLLFWIALSLPAVLYFMDFPLMQALADANIPLILFFGLSGYLLFSTIYVSMGATMDDLQSAGNTQSMMMMIPMLSFLFIGPLVRNPEGSIAVFASIFPLTSPLIMIMRSAFIKVSIWEVALSAAILLFSIWFMISVAAKIFRVGMLMYGKTANINEIIKWITYKDR